MDSTTKKHNDRPKVSLLSIINFFLILITLLTVLSISSRLGGQPSTKTASNDTTALQQQVTALSTKLDEISSTLASNKPASTRPFNYLQCNGNITSIGSISTVSSQCYPY
jgi:cytoskeletal protein RodZ